VNGKGVIGPTAAIFDTGSSLITGDPATVSRFYERIPGAKPAPVIGEGYYSSALRDAFT
jgi:hypothetical protein